MRVFKFTSLAVLAALLCVDGVAAQDEPTNLPQFWQEQKEINLSRGKSNRDEPQLKGTSTTFFEQTEGINQGNEDFDDGMVGIIIGFAVTAVFLLIAATLVITDEVLRHKTYSALIARDLRKFKTDWDYTDGQMANLEKEFEELEAKRGQSVDAAAAAKELQEIN